MAQSHLPTPAHNNGVACNLFGKMQTLLDHWNSGLITDYEFIVRVHGDSLGAVLDMRPIEPAMTDENTGLKCPEVL